MIPFARPFLPPQEEYAAMLAGIWQRSWLSNDGPLVQQLEQKLQQYLGLDHLLLTANGTLALQFAIKALAPAGEIITTPFSYIATVSAAIWEGCTPVFADIDTGDYNLNPDCIEACITNKTVAILATHVFGNPCNVPAIQAIAMRHGLKVLYDAAHCFGTMLGGRSVFSYGDASVASLHATKLFHTAEGGFVTTSKTETSDFVFYARNFGHNGPGRFEMMGINGKMSELHAAMGLCNFNHIEALLTDRKRIWNAYQERLSASGLVLLKLREVEGYNYAYFPVRFGSEDALLKQMAKMEAAGIHPRRYFYPSLSRVARSLFSPVVLHVNKTPIADALAPCVLCLPMYHGMTDEETDLVCSVLCG